MKIKNVILVILLILFSKSISLAIPVFTQEEDVRLSSAIYKISILQTKTSNYRMFFSTGYGILSSTSSDCLNWSLEKGFRIEPSTFQNYDSNSVSNPTIIEFTTYYRMIYEGTTFNGTTQHFFLSAISTDTLNWTKEIDTTTSKSKIRYKSLNNGATQYISCPDVIQLADNKWIMYYVKRANIGNDEYIYCINSSDTLSWSSERQCISESNVTTPKCVKLSNGTYRLFYSAYDGKDIYQAIKSAISSDGINFSVELNKRISTSYDIELFVAEVVKVNGYKWRLYYTIGTSDPFDLYSAIADTPKIDTITPYVGRNIEIVEVTIAGEIFDSIPTVKLTRSGCTDISGTDVKYINDMQLSTKFNLIDKLSGVWNVVVTNPDGKYDISSSGFTISINPGELSLIDNLFNPMRNETVKINFKIYEGGNIKIRIYTIDGRLVRNLVNKSYSRGAYTEEWNGMSDDASFVASGVYLINAEGPGLNKYNKIIVIK